MSGFLKLGVLTGIGAFPFLCLQCLNQSAALIEHELQNTVHTALKDDQFRGVTVAGDGRHIVLAGTVSVESARRNADHLTAALLGVASVDNRLAVSGGAAEAQLRIRLVLSKRNIQFEPGKSDLADPEQPVLDDLLVILKDTPNSNIQVEGYTDNSGDEDKNRVISRKRAQAVVNWLAEHGIARPRLSAIGFGPDNPLVSNDTSEGRARNRRIEMKLSDR